MNAIRVTIFGALLGAGSLFSACSSSDNNPTPGTPDSGSGATPGAGGKTSGGGSTSAGGKTSGGGAGGATNAGGSGNTDAGSTGGIANDSGAGGQGTGGTVTTDGGKCSSGEQGTFNGTPTTTTEFLNHCTNSTCIPFDNSGLPNPLPSL